MAKVKKLTTLIKLTKKVKQWQYPIGAGFVFLIAVSFFIYPKSQLQITKEKLAKNQNDYHAHLELAEKLLENSQFEKAEEELAWLKSPPKRGGQVLGEKTDFNIENLWQKKYFSNLSDIQRLAGVFEKIIAEKPQYRDGYLQLAFLYYQLYQKDLAEEYLQKALEIDPNYYFSNEFKRLLGAKK